MQNNEIMAHSLTFFVPSPLHSSRSSPSTTPATAMGPPVLHSPLQTDIPRVIALCVFLEFLVPLRSPR